MMISKTTFVAIVSMLMKHIDDKKELLECSGDCLKNARSASWKKLSFSRI